MTTTRWDAEEQFDDKESIGIVLFNQHRDSIATFSGIGYQDFANAKLCAAAPDLLGALQNIVNRISEAGQDSCGQDMVKVRAALIDEARSAIAKATA